MIKERIDHRQSAKRMPADYAISCGGVMGIDIRYQFLFYKTHKVFASPSLPGLVLVNQLVGLYARWRQIAFAIGIGDTHHDHRRYQAAHLFLNSYCRLEMLVTIQN